MSQSDNLPLRLSLDETVLLLVGLKLLDEMVEAIEINGLAQGGLLGDLMTKLNAVLPEELAEMAGDIVEDIVASSVDELESMTADSSYALPMYAVDGTLPVIEEAIAACRTVEVSYYSMSREEFNQRRIDPYGLKQDGNLYWVVAHCHMRDDRRVFRLDRMKEAHLTADAFVRPPDFRMGEYFEDED